LSQSLVGASSFNISHFSLNSVETVASKKPTVDFATAILRAEREADGNHNGHPPELEYLMKPDGHLALVHVIQVQDDDAGTWHEVFIDAHSEQLLALNDFSSHATASNFHRLFEMEPDNGRSTQSFPSPGTRCRLKDSRL
jgi:hypothetical protein